MDVIWIAFDTPVDDDDKSLPLVVVDYVVSLFDHLRSGPLSSSPRSSQSAQRAGSPARRLAAAATTYRSHTARKIFGSAKQSRSSPSPTA